MNDNLYIKTLEIGMRQSEGVSFNEIVERLDINTSDVNFEANFAIWFYSNFYNYYVESLIVGQLTASNSDYRINPTNLENKVRPHNDKKSFIKGDAVNKYIDYLELERTRKSSQTAKVFSIISIIIATVAVIAPIILNTQNESTTKDIKVTPEIITVENSDSAKISDSLILVKDSIQTAK